MTVTKEITLVMIEIITQGVIVSLIFNIINTKSQQKYFQEINQQLYYLKREIISQIKESDK